MIEPVITVNQFLSTYYGEWCITQGDDVTMRSTELGYEDVYRLMNGIGRAEILRLEWDFANDRIVIEVY